MKRLIQFPLEEKSESILVEVYEQDISQGAHRVARPAREDIEKAPQSFEQALSKIRPATEKVIAALHGLASKPSEIEMEFGFNLSAEAGVFIASVSTEANYKVVLRWKKDE